MIVSAAVKLEREKRKTAREERLWQLVNDPNIKRLLALSAIVAYSSYVTGRKDAGRTETALALALPALGIPMIAADAGIKDAAALIAIGAVSGTVAGIASDKVVDAVTLEGPDGIPVLSLLGPIANIRWLSKQWSERIG